MSSSMFHLGFMVYRDTFVVRRVNRLRDEVENRKDEMFARYLGIRGAG